MFNLLLAGAGLAASAIGGYSQYKSSKETAAAQSAAIREQIKAEKRAEEIRKKAMELDARRRMIETVRQQQRARSSALAVATSQGSSGGSGLQGAYAGISGQTGVNALGITQNLDLGYQMFDANSALSRARINYADATSAGNVSMARAQGISNIGSVLMNNSGTLSNLAGNFTGGAGASAPSYGGWYNLSQTGGYPFPTPYR